MSYPKISVDGGLAFDGESRNPGDMGITAAQYFEMDGSERTSWKVEISSNIRVGDLLAINNRDKVTLRIEVCEGVFIVGEAWPEVTVERYPVYLDVATAQFTGDGALRKAE